VNSRRHVSGCGCMGTAHSTVRAFAETARLLARVAVLPLEDLDGDRRRVGPEGVRREHDLGGHALAQRAQHPARQRSTRVTCLKTYCCDPRSMADDGLRQPLQAMAVISEEVSKPRLAVTPASAEAVKSAGAYTICWMRDVQVFLSACL